MVSSLPKFGLVCRPDRVTRLMLLSSFIHRLSYSTLANDAVWRWNTKEDRQWSRDRNPSPDGGEFWKLWTSLNSWSRTAASGSLMKPAGSNSRHFDDWTSDKMWQGDKDISVVLTFLDIFCSLIPWYHKEYHNNIAFKKWCYSSQFRVSKDHDTSSHFASLVFWFNFQDGNDGGWKLWTRNFHQVRPLMDFTYSEDGMLPEFCVKDLVWNNANVPYHTGMNHIWKSICFVCVCFFEPEAKIRVLQSGIRCGLEQQKKGHGVMGRDVWHLRLSQAKAILELLNDNDMLRSEREKAMELWVVLSSIHFMFCQ